MRLMCGMSSGTTALRRRIEGTTHSPITSLSVPSIPPYGHFVTPYTKTDPRNMAICLNSVIASLTQGYVFCKLGVCRLFFASLCDKKSPSLGCHCQI